MVIKSDKENDNLDDVLEKGMKIWFPHQEDGWRSGIIVDAKDKEHIAVFDEEDESQEYDFPASCLFLQNPGILEGVEDMTTLSYLSEPAILHNLQTRYSLNIIYTYTGSILIAVNPYQKLNIYSKEMIDMYCGQPLGKLSPHVYAMADEAYRSMLYEGNQSILVSGESGAGKTETTKFLLQYFAAMGALKKERTKESSVKETVETRVLESTPLLEAFGNAKTLRNDNSSRFGKFIEIQFDKDGVIVGAKLKTYLLEKSRIIRQANQERNYHIFYQLTKGASEEEKEDLKLLDAEESNFLSQSGCIDVEDVSDEEQFKRTKSAMDIVGIPTEEQREAFSLLSAILHLGELEFEEGSSTDSSLITNKETLEICALLLGCDSLSLEKYMCNKKMVVGAETLEVPLDSEKASSTRDALAMLLYSRLFDWLVQKINVSIQSKKSTTSFIGVLDIYGFESFESNSFEQFCINYANEKLQQQFNQHVFKLEQKEYEKEKIDWSYIEFNDNQECLDLLEKKPICILSILDEECRFPKATSQTFAQKLFSNFLQQKKHKYFEKPRFSNQAFTVHHYAGEVTYETDGFLEKNQDFIIPEHIAMMEESSNVFLKNIFKKFVANAQATGSKKSKTNTKSSYHFVSVGSQFRESLSALMDVIHTTAPHYVRCIKPNNLKKPLLFDKPQVIHQLRCGGVLECIRISKAGYPTRKPYESFLKRYKLLAPKVNLSKYDKNSEKCAAILKEIGLREDQYQCGLTKIFLRAGELARFEKRRHDLMMYSATQIQKMWRGYSQQKKYLQIKHAIVILQSFTRMVIAKATARLIRQTNASIKLQSVIRMWIQRKRFVLFKNAAICLQNAIRTFHANDRLMELKRGHAIIFLQSIIRGHHTRTHYLCLKRATILAQTRWRGKLARRLYSELRIEARKLSNVVAQKNKLEQKVEDLQWKLEAEVRTRQKLERKLTEGTSSEVKQLKEANKLLEEEVESVKRRLSETELKHQEEISQLKSLLEESEKQKMDIEKEYEDKLENYKEKLANYEEKLGKYEEQAKEKIEPQNEITTSKEPPPPSVKTSEEDKQLEQKYQEELENLKNSLTIESEQKIQAEKEIESLKDEINELKMENESLMKLYRMNKSDSFDKESIQEDKMLGYAVEKELKSNQGLTKGQTLQKEVESEELMKLREELEIEKTEKRKIQKSLKEEVENTNKLANDVFELKRKLQEKKLEKENEALRKKLKEMEQVCSSLKDKLEQVSVRKLGKSTSNLPPIEIPTFPKEEDAATPELSLVVSTIKATGSKEKGEKVFIDLLHNRVLANFKEKSEPYMVFCNILPLPTFIIFRCLMEYPEYWNDSIFNYTIDSMNKLLKDAKTRENTDLLSYWLSNSCVLLHLTMKEEDKTQPIEMLNTSKAMRLYGSKETDTPVKKLTLLVIKMYAILLEDIYHTLKPLLFITLESDSSKKKESMSKVTGFLSNLLTVLEQNFLNLKLVQFLFHQVFFFINATLFNEIMLRRDLCTSMKGVEIKRNLSMLEDWARRNENKDWLKDATSELEPLRQLVSVLAINKNIITNPEVRQEVCPSITGIQLRQLLTMYQHDEMLEEPVSLSVIKSIPYNIEDQVCFDTSSLYPLNPKDLHYLRPTDLSTIVFPFKMLQQEFETTLINPRGSEKSQEKENKSWGLFSFMYK